jgi:hypothetical protein
MHKGLLYLSGYFEEEKDQNKNLSVKYPVLKMGPTLPAIAWVLSIPLMCIEGDICPRLQKSAMSKPYMY